MFAHTCFTNCSRFGYSCTVLKSGICKYFRRDEDEKFEWCVGELLGFRNCEVGNGGNAIVSNMINRLRVLLMEDLSCLEIGRIVKGIELLDAFDADRTNVNLIGAFCKVVEGGKKNRYVSYVKCWWYNRECVYVDACEEKILFLEKDSERVRHVARNFSRSLALGDDAIVRMFLEMVECKESCGMRWRRKDCVYVLWEILEKYIHPCIFKFALNRFFKKTLMERVAFGVWACVLALNAVRGIRCVEKFEEEIKFDEEFEDNVEKLKMDGYVVEDWHVNKKFGMKKFGEVGSLVLNEDLKDLAHGEEYRDFYRKIKSEKVEKKKCKKGEKKEKRVKKEEKEIVHAVIDWSDFKVIKVLEEGVCGGKVCCIKIEYKDEMYILKEMRKSFRYGLDYFFMDGLKKDVGLMDLGMQIIESNVGLVKMDEGNRSFVGNWELKERKGVRYCMMRFIENEGDVGKMKGLLLKNKEVKREVMMIRIFDGLFRSSDNILRNILVCEGKKRVVSIDEGDIFGKRRKIFNKNDWCLKNYTWEDVEGCVDEVVMKIDAEKVVGKMEEFGFERFCEEFRERHSHLKNIVRKEWNNNV